MFMHIIDAKIEIVNYLEFYFRVPLLAALLYISKTAKKTNFIIIISSTQHATLYLYCGTKRMFSKEMFIIVAIESKCLQKAELISKRSLDVTKCLFQMCKNGNRAL